MPFNRGGYGGGTYSGGGNRGGGGWGNRGGGDQGGMRQEFPNSGAVFGRDKTSDKSPDLGGNFSIDNEVLDYVLACAERNEKVTLEISAWRKQSRSGNNYMSITVNIPYKVRNPNAQFRNQPRFGGGGQNFNARNDPNRFDDTPPPRRGGYGGGDDNRRGGYAEQSGRDVRGRADDDFKRGDSLPDFMRDERDNRDDRDRDNRSRDPNEPPF